MILRILYFHIVLSCFVIPGLLAKPVSLNELIAAEEKQKNVSTPTPSKLVLGNSETVPLNELQKPSSTKSKKVGKTKGSKAKPGKGLSKKPFSLKELLPDISHERSTAATHSWAPKRFSLDKILTPRTGKLKKLLEKGFTKKPLYLIDEELVVEESKAIGKSTPEPESSERFSLNRILKPKSGKSKKLKTLDNIFPPGKKLSTLHFRKIFEIKSPLKPKKLKDIKKDRNRRRRNQSSKREISEDDNINHKYIPLLRSLSMLFDNIMVPSSDDIKEVKGVSFPRNRRPNSDKRNDSCACSKKFNAEIKSTTTKETVTSTTPIIEISTVEPATTEIATTSAYHITDGDISGLGQHTDLPPILSGDTNSTRRDDNGIVPRSGPTFYPSIERNITGDNGNSEHDTGSGQTSPRSKSNKENPYSDSRNYASSVRFGGRHGGDGTDIRRPVYRRGLDDTINSSEGKESFRNSGGNFDVTERQDKFEVRGDATESSISVPKLVRGERFVSENNVVTNSESLQPEKGYEESNDSVRFNLSGDQRVTFGDGSSSAEDQKPGPTNAVISISDLSNPIIMLQNNPKHKAPYVTIIDGYSIARDKNGSNKIAEQSIRIHS